MNYLFLNNLKDQEHTNLNQLTMLCHQGEINCADIASVNKILKKIWDELVCIKK